MKKINVDYNPQVIEDYINDIQKKLPNYEVNINNCNDFQIMLDNKEACINCKSLKTCPNENPGHYLSFIDGDFSLVECKLKKEDKMLKSKSSLIKALYMPLSVLDAKLESFDTNSESRRKIYQFTLDFIRNFKDGKNPKGLYLNGTFSIGKTYTLACIANELSKNNISSLLIYFPDLVVDLKSAMGSNRFDELLNMLKSIDVLMLDDVGSENMTPWLRDEVLGPIINYRALEHKPVFFSSNLKGKEYKDFLAFDGNITKSERIFSRIQAVCITISMDDGNKYQR